MDTLYLGIFDVIIYFTKFPLCRGGRWDHRQAGRPDSF